MISGLTFSLTIGLNLVVRTVQLSKFLYSREQEINQVDGNALIRRIECRNGIFTLASMDTDLGSSSHHTTRVLTTPSRLGPVQVLSCELEVRCTSTRRTLTSRTLAVL